MAEKRRVRRISVNPKIKVIDPTPKGVTYLLDISVCGAQLETTTKYRLGDLIEFSYIPPGPSSMAIEVQRKGDPVWTIPSGLFRKEILRGRVVRVVSHPHKANHFLVGLDLSTKRHMPYTIILIIFILVVI